MLLLRQLLNINTTYDDKFHLQTGSYEILYNAVRRVTTPKKQSIHQQVASS